MAAEPLRLTQPAIDERVEDLRFRALIGNAAWQRLPERVRRRFSKRVADGRAVVYVGEIVEACLSMWGRVLARLTSLIGGPLPISAETGVPAIVSVTEEGATGGQIWTRIYGRRRGFPQIIHSAKRFAGATGLEEHVGCGIGMALTVHADENAIVFRSAGYFLRLAGRRLSVPRWLEPGNITVTHTEIGAGRFAFTLHMEHRLLGLLIHQHAVFSDTM